MTRPMEDLLDTAEKIRSMEIRGAALIGRAAASALKEFALAIEPSGIDEFRAEVGRAADILLNTRPTAVSLSNAIRMVMRYRGDDLESARRSLAKNADGFVERSLLAVEKIGEIGSRRIRDGDVILTHCNSSVALSIIKTAFDSGKDIKVIATESRPRFQGHLTIKTLDGWGIATELVVDSAVRTVINEVDQVIVGADVVTANGSLVNKIGTAAIALAASEARTSFMVAAETYKFSPETLMGELVPIEMRAAEEVYPEISELKNVRVRNPAFDVTPHQYIDVICTEVGAIPPEMSYLVIKEMLGWEMKAGGGEITLF
jgi:ribose 1,5-bisphosphate isomerase